MSNERERLIARLRRFAVVLEARGETYDAETCEQAIASLSAPVAEQMVRSLSAWEQVWEGIRDNHEPNLNPTNKPLAVAAAFQLAISRAERAKQAEPDPMLINSMAMRYRHDFGLLDEREQNSIRTTMRQLWEEVVGLGFYKASPPAVQAEPTKYEQAERERDEAVRLLREAREELDTVEYPNDPPRRVLKMLDAIDAYLAKVEK